MPLPRRHFLAMTATFAACPVGAEEVPVIAAAASLRFVMADLLDAFRDKTGTGLRVTFGASGVLAQQISNGAPFEVFLSADDTLVSGLAGDGFLQDEGIVYARGRLALIAPQASPMMVDDRLDGVAAALDAGILRRFSIANPRHAPYGQRAREALVHRGLWGRIEPHLVIGENASQAAQFALSGNAEGGVIAASLVAAGPLKGHGRSVLIPEAWHRPMQQRMALGASTGEGARRFYAFLQTAAARDIFTAHGYDLPEPA